MNNIDKYISLLDGQVDGLLLTSRYSRHYGAQFDIAEGVAIVSKAGCRYFTDSRYIESAENGIQGFQVRMMDRSNPYGKLINEAIADFGITTLGYEENYLSVAEFMGYEQTLNAKLVPFHKQISSFRSIKEEWELELMRKAQAITDKAFSEILNRIHVGMTEKELAAELIYCLYKCGGEGLSFPPIVVSGPNTSLPHGVPGERRISEGDFVTMDFGVVYQGYCSDMTRTVAVGSVTEEMRAVYNTVLKAQTSAIAASKPGITGEQIDGIARSIITEAGYGQYFGHGYGHSLGLEVHENPRCAPGHDTVIVKGMVSSAEPGIYLPGKFGVRIEDCIIFTEDGNEDMAKSPKNLIIV